MNNTYLSGHIHISDIMSVNVGFPVFIYRTHCIIGEDGGACMIPEHSNTTIYRRMRRGGPGMGAGGCRPPRIFEEAIFVQKIIILVEPLNIRASGSNIHAKKANIQVNPPFFVCQTFAKCIT